MIRTFTILISFFFLIAINGCSDCSRFKDEVYTKDNEGDSSFIAIMNRYFNDLLLPNLINTDFESYRLVVSSAFKEGTHGIIIFSKNKEGCILKTINYKMSFVDTIIKAEIIDTSIKVMPIEKWLAFEDLVYASKYWTLPRTDNREVLDGVGYYLEASRPQAKACNKRTHQIVIRQSPANDDLFSFVCLWLMYNSQLK